jgi:hypothetical protein
MVFETSRSVSFSMIVASSSQHKSPPNRLCPADSAEELTTAAETVDRFEFPRMAAAVHESCAAAAVQSSASAAPVQSSGAAAPVQSSGAAAPVQSSCAAAPV